MEQEPPVPLDADAVLFGSARGFCETVTCLRHFPTGTRRRSSSKKLNTKVTSCSGLGGSGVLHWHLHSQVLAVRRQIKPRSSPELRCPASFAAHTRGFSGTNKSPFTVYYTAMIWSPDW